MSSGGLMAECPPPPCRPSTTHSAFTEPPSGKHWCESDNYNSIDEALGSSRQRGMSSTLNASASRMARLRHLDQKVVGIGAGKRLQSSPSQDSGEVLVSEDLLTARGSKSMLSPRMPSARKQHMIKSEDIRPHTRENSRLLADDGDRDPGKPAAAKSPPEKSSSKARHVNGRWVSKSAEQDFHRAAERDRHHTTSDSATIERRRSVDSAVATSFESLHDVAWDDSAPDGDDQSAAEKAADPASHGFLSAWTEKDPCSLITSMANQFYPQSSQTVADAEAKRNAIFNALGIDLAAEDSSVDVRKPKPRKRNSFHLSSETRGRERRRASSPDRLDLSNLKIQGCESNTEPVPSARKSGRGHVGLQERTDDEIRPHRRNGSTLPGDASPSVLTQSPPSPLFGLSSSDQSSQQLQWRPFTSLQPLRSVHHYHYDMRSEPEYQRFARQCIIATTAISAQQKARTSPKSGADLGRSPVKKIVSAEELQHQQQVCPSPRHNEQQQYLGSVPSSGNHHSYPGFVPSTPPMQSGRKTPGENRRTHPAGHHHVLVPSRNGAANLNPVGSVGHGHRSLFNVAREHHHLPFGGRPGTSSGAPYHQGSAAGQIGPHVRTFGNHQQVPLMMVRSSNSIPSPGSNRTFAPLMVGIGAGGGNTAWPDSRRTTMLDLSSRNGISYY